MSTSSIYHPFTACQEPYPRLRTSYYPGEEVSTQHEAMPMFNIYHPRAAPELDGSRLCPKEASRLLAIDAESPCHGREMQHGLEHLPTPRNDQGIAASQSFFSTSSLYSDPGVIEICDENPPIDEQDELCRASVNGDWPLGTQPTWASFYDHDAVPSA